MVWNPLAQREARTFPLKHSGGAASATFRPWSARERVAYDDALTTRLMDMGVSTADVDPDDPDAPMPERDIVIRMGSLKLLQLALTIDSVDGFPSTCEIVETTDDGLEQRREVPFNPRDERCLLALDDVTYAELQEYAELVQTPPGSQISDADLEQLASDGGDDAEDPTQRPPTPQDQQSDQQDQQPSADG